MPFVHSSVLTELITASRAAEALAISAFKVGACVPKFSVPISVFISQACSALDSGLPHGNNPQNLNGDVDVLLLLLAGSSRLTHNRRLVQDSLSQQILDELLAGNSAAASTLIAQALNSGNTQAVSQALAASTATVWPLLAELNLLPRAWHVISELFQSPNYVLHTCN